MNAWSRSRRSRRGTRTGGVRSVAPEADARRVEGGEPSLDLLALISETLGEIDFVEYLTEGSHQWENLHEKVFPSRTTPSASVSGGGPDRRLLPRG